MQLLDAACAARTSSSVVRSRYLAALRGQAEEQIPLNPPFPKGEEERVASSLFEPFVASLSNHERRARAAVTATRLTTR